MVYVNFIKNKSTALINKLLVYDFLNLLIEV
jgi:hypothetical protein